MSETAKAQLAEHVLGSFRPTNPFLQSRILSRRDSSTTAALGISSGYAFNETSGTTTADVRIANHALTQDQIQTDMVTPLAGAANQAATGTVVINGDAAATNDRDGDTHSVRAERRYADALFK